MRETSIKAYHEAVESGLIGERQERFLSIVARYGPLTSMEATRQAKIEDGSVGLIPNTRARFTELSQMGVIAEVGKRKCRVTGRTVTVWDMSGRAPVKIGSRASRAAKLKEAVADAICSLEQGYWVDALRALKAANI